MMKKTEDAEKVADEIAGVDEENPASKKITPEFLRTFGFRP